MNFRNLLLASVLALLPAAAIAMDLKSSSTSDGAAFSLAQLHKQCNGANISPALSWSGAPAETKSFAVTMFDPDASGAGFWHWIVFDIPPAVTSLPQSAGSDAAALPAGSLQGANDFGDLGYGGACPPPGSGPHHYEITVWALDTASLPFGARTTGAQIGPYLDDHVLDKARIIPTYER